MPSIWILGMFQPFGTTWVVIPFRGEATPDVVNDRYFAKIPPDRIEVRQGYVLFKCDGELRSKIGVGPARAVSTIGSYTPAVNLLTLVQLDPLSSDAPYVNSLWEIHKEPYAGDVVNSYNDGPPEPGKPAFGGFYELETSSPALALAAGQSAVHTHRTIHLSGDKTELDRVAQGALGVTATVIGRGISRQ